MKKLLLIAVIGCFAHDAGAMICKKVENGKFLPIFRPIVEPKDLDVLDRVQEPLLDQLADVESLVINKGQRDAAKKTIIKLWCDEFKLNSRKNNNDENKEGIAGCFIIGTDFYNITGLEQNLGHEIKKLNSKNWFHSQSDLEFEQSIGHLQLEEWTKWHAHLRNSDLDDNFGKTSLILVKYENSDRTERFLRFASSPYYKTVKFSRLFTRNELENNAYHEALHSLLVTKKVMEHNLNLAKSNLENPSLLQRIKKTIWSSNALEKHNKSLCEHENYQKSIDVLSGEIALFKEQDKIVWNPTILGPSETILSHRDVFTKSCMSTSFFKKLKMARE